MNDANGVRCLVTSFASVPCSNRRNGLLNWQSYVVTCRSLHFCINGVGKNRDLITKSGESQHQAGLLHAQLHYRRVEYILDHGLHQGPTDFMDRIYLLGDGISKGFLMPTTEAA